MRCFVDTSAFIALLNRDDRFHGRAKARWQELLSDDVPLVTSNYVIMETFTLAMHRLGRRAAKDFNDAVVPVLETVWINEDIHGAAVSSIVVSGKRNLSLWTAAALRSCGAWAWKGPSPSNGISATRGSHW